MAFLIKPNTSYEEFKRLLDEWFPNIRRQVAEDPNIGDHVIRHELVNDYARIGAYLTHENLVLNGLKKLEEALERKLKARREAEAGTGDTKFTTLSATLSKPAAGHFMFPSGRNARGESISFKTHKLLSSTLQDLEDLNNFNGRAGDTFEKVPAMDLYPGAKVARNPGPAVASTAPGRDAVAFVRLPDAATPSNWPAGGKPVGVPAISGILGQAFNKTLLRHGYHFKDPGAGIAHGEYTHRLQWYAVTEDRTTVGIINSPLNIFRSLGSDWCKHQRIGLANDGSGLTGYYMWEALFDCALPTTAAADWRPHSLTFTCPEAMLKKLTPMMLQGTDPLFLLKALMRARNTKRSGNVAGGDSTFERQDYGLRFTDGSSKRIETATGFKGAYLFWYLNGQ